MTKKIKLRSLLIGGFFTLLFVVLIAKVYWIQVVDASWLLEQAEEKWETDKIIAPVRGAILDRNNKVLAEEGTAYTVTLNPKMIDSLHAADDIARGLADILKESDVSKATLENKIRELATRKKPDGSDFAVNVEIRNEGWKIDKEKADQVRDFITTMQTRLNKSAKTNIGIGIIEEKKRYYPGETLAAHILGYTNKEGKASLGLELKLDDTLKGVPGMLSYEKDGKGVELPDAKVDFKPAEDGNNVRLTIDKNIQFYLESALAKVNDKWHPKSLTAIAVDPQTMEILGMANTPTFNPNTYWNIKDQSDFKNNAVASRYEPGSTFKIVTLAGTVEEGLFNPNEMYQSGMIRVQDRELHDHNRVGWGKISYLDGLKRSSNVAFVKLGIEKLTQPKLKSYIEKFGFNEKTNIDMPNEVSGLIDMKYPSEYATATYGQGKVVVTAIQQTAAYAAMANGGKLMWPHIVKDIIDPKTGKTIQSFAPQVVRQVVSEKTAATVSGYLEQVVSDQDIGTGKLAYMEGYRVAGKTGTANLVLPGEKTYSTNTWVISFIGYAPVEDPKILVTLIADQPDLGGNYHLGGQVLAPAFKDIVGESLQYMGVKSSKQTQMVAKEANKLKVPNFMEMTSANAKAAAKESNLPLEVFGKGDQVVDQFPKPGTEILSTQRIYVAMQNVSEMPLPNLVGRSLRDAVEACSFFKVDCQTSGEGYVSEQTSAGEGEGRSATLTLKPLSDKPAVAGTK
ncbi:penicillin-binding transpeptidase domain-containing protein [Paenibacillus chondroitinus]|uniref:Penicillin-binding transpeptidase domain-containing protein n=1 Tax=Paenibacillus chondroitinus TaxID=59842 RepID=A0ABU6D4H7_9BACL|nr:MULTISPECIES: penicillin-binding transpeptidase domain-containing protein [Paenibacillus]MCY9658373.1 penicillin-binding transpeptidase domain-containing protein [Paenibacillus anseongense]MEB4792628.1 penicillin-binding transpeptidase domain-containing protein [Paenibacillus chondroitinus]